METAQHAAANLLILSSFIMKISSVFDSQTVPNGHWHTELSLFYIESGTVTLWIGEDQFHLTEGNGIFINHKGTPSPLFLPQKPSFPILYFYALLLLPLMDSLIYQKHILPIISSSLPFLVFHKKVCWQAKVLSIMRQIISAQDSVLSKELLTSSLLQNLWLEIFENTDISYQEEHKDHSTASQARLQLMLQFIHLNYSRSISYWMTLQNRQWSVKVPL
ncbi:MAG: AraC family ligand binding domain-containing protein [Clostridium fessum]